MIVTLTMSLYICRAIQGLGDTLYNFFSPLYSVLYLLQKLGVPAIHYYVANLPKVKAWPCRMACFHGWQGGSFVGMLVLMFTGGLPMWPGILRTLCLGVGQGRERERIFQTWKV